MLTSKTQLAQQLDSSPAISVSKQSKHAAKKMPQRQLDEEQLGDKLSRLDETSSSSSSGSAGSDNSADSEQTADSSWQFNCKFTLSEVQQHGQLDDCWMVIFDKVYNITEFVNEHPGGDYILLEYAGRDATHPFLSSRHGSSAYKLLDKYWIGILVDEELYYSNNSSYCSVYSNLSWRHRAPISEPQQDSKPFATATTTTTTTSKQESTIETPEEPEPESETNRAATTTTSSSNITSVTSTSTQPRAELAAESDHSGLGLGDGATFAPSSEIELANNLRDTCSSLVQLWSKVTRAVLNRASDRTVCGSTTTAEADTELATATSRSTSRLQSCIRSIALASGWFIL